MRFVLLMMLLLLGGQSIADNAKFEACRKKLIQAQNLSVLQDLQWQKGNEPYVLAGPTFFDMAIDGKEGFATTVNCFLMSGDTTKCIGFNVLHWQTGKSVGRFENCRFKML